MDPEPGNLLAWAKELHRGMEHHHHEVARRTERLVHRRKIRWFLELKTIVTVKCTVGTFGLASLVIY